MLSPDALKDFGPSDMCDGRCVDEMSLDFGSRTFTKRACGDQIAVPPSSVCPVPMNRHERLQQHACIELCDYSITSSARASSMGGTLRPIAFAVFPLITISNLVACSTGRSLGLAPLKILSTIPAARR